MNVDELAGRLDAAGLSAALAGSYCYADNVAWIVEGLDGDPAGWRLYIAVVTAGGLLAPESVIDAADVENWEGTMWHDTEPSGRQLAAAARMFGEILLAGPAQAGLPARVGWQGLQPHAEIAWDRVAPAGDPDEALRAAGFPVERVDPAQTAEDLAALARRDARLREAEEGRE